MLSTLPIICESWTTRIETSWERLVSWYRFQFDFAWLEYNHTNGSLLELRSAFNILHVCIRKFHIMDIIKDDYFPSLMEHWALMNIETANLEEMKVWCTTLDKLLLSAGLKVTSPPDDLTSGFAMSRSAPDFLNEIQDHMEKRDPYGSEIIYLDISMHHIHRLLACFSTIFDCRQDMIDQGQTTNIGVLDHHRLTLESLIDLTRTRLIERFRKELNEWFGLESAFAKAGQIDNSCKNLKIVLLEMDIARSKEHFASIDRHWRQLMLASTETNV